MQQPPPQTALVPIPDPQTGQATNYISIPVEFLQSHGDITIQVFYGNDAPPGSIQISANPDALTASGQPLITMVDATAATQTPPVAVQKPYELQLLHNGPHHSAHHHHAYGNEVIVEEDDEGKQIATLMPAAHYPPDDDLCLSPPDDPFIVTGGDPTLLDSQLGDDFGGYDETHTVSSSSYEDTMKLDSLGSYGDPIVYSSKPVELFADSPSYAGISSPQHHADDSAYPSHYSSPKPEAIAADLRVIKHKAPLEAEVLNSDDRPFRCAFPACGKAFTTQRFLNMHSEIHAPRIYSCSVCSRSYATMQKLRKHVSTVHKGSRPHQCNVEGCGKSFGTASNLNAHMRSHTGERPYECSVCGKTFGHHSHAKAHLKIHLRHQTSMGGEEPRVMK